MFKSRKIINFAYLIDFYKHTEHMKQTQMYPFDVSLIKKKHFVYVYLR